MIPGISPSPDTFERPAFPDPGRVAPVEHRLPRNRATAAVFLTVDELAASDREDLGDRLTEADRRQLDEMARQGYLDGHARGLEEGYAAGHDQAMREVVARMRGALEALDAAARRLGAADAVTLSELDGQVAGFAVDVAESILGHELAARTEPGADAIARAIALAPERGEIVARLHPTDVDAVGDVGLLAPGRGVTVVADANVQPGGCVLDVGACRIDAQLGPALDRVRKLLASPTTPEGLA